MGRKLKLDWSKLLPGRPVSPPPPPELEVVPAPSGGGTAEAAQRVEEEEETVAEFSDHELQEKVQRILKNITSGVTRKLRDGGAKLRSHLRRLQDELDRRKLVRFQKDVRDHNFMVRSETKELAGSYNHSSLEFVTSKCPSQSSLALSFSQKLDNKPGAERNDTSKSTNRNKCTSIWVSGQRMHKGTEQARMSLEQAKVSLRQPCNDRKRFFSDCYSGAKLIASHGGGNSSSRFSKRYASRGRASENIDLMNLKSNEDLVLLDEEDVQRRQSDGDSHVARKEAKIYYPSRDDRNCVELSYLDGKCLEPESYLSSTVMNFYIQYIQQKILPISRVRGRCYFFNTYFYKKLEEAMSSKDDHNACFLKLRRWWKDVDIFQKAYIFLPVHMNMHWSLVIICIPAKEDLSGPILLHLDSLGLHDSSLVFDVIYRFVKEEWIYVNEKALSTDAPLSDEIWEELPQRIERKIVKVPQQTNQYDCGIFVLYYMKRFIKDAPERLRRKDLLMFGSDWFKPEKASRLREQIMELLIKEFENASFDDAGTQSPSSFSYSP